MKLIEQIDIDAAEIILSDTPVFIETETSAELPPEPELSDALKANAEFSLSGENFDQAGLQVGELAVNFTLKDIDGQEQRLSRLLATGPVVMEFGSFT